MSVTIQCIVCTLFIIIWDSNIFFCNVYCFRGEDISTILYRVNSEVGQKEGSVVVGRVKQMPEFKVTLMKRLVLSPHRN